MARLLRITPPGVAHPVTQRRKRRQTVFIEAQGQALYRDLPAQHGASNGIKEGPDCLMSNPMYLIILLIINFVYSSQISPPGLTWCAYSSSI